jgi:DNA processing protein
MESNRPRRLEAALRLHLTPGIGPRLRQALLERFGDCESVLRAAPAELRAVDGIGPKLASNIVDRAAAADVDGLLELCRQTNISVILDEDAHYPRPLRNIVDPPPVLYAFGQWLPQDAVAVGIVGTRHATRYGLEQAARLAAGLARAGVTIVSGLARGIDAAAHKGALEAGGRTLAVLGSGLLNLYPPEHADLAREVVAAGAMLSEQPPNAEPFAGAFPQRNRVISGLSLGVIVVEAAERSGALITARLAMEQGREVFAVPGRVSDRNSRGCHRLLRDGATLVEKVDDVLEQLGPLVEPTSTEDGREIRHPAELRLNETEQAVLQAIDSDPTSVDAIVSRTALPIHQVLATLSALEIRHLVSRLSGTTVTRRFG